MALKFHPRPGTLLICNFDTGFRRPEMVKKRPVVVISPRRRRSSGLCTVVPLSTRVPDTVQRFHHRLETVSLPPGLRTENTWAKCDMVTTVSMNGLDRVLTGRDRDGKRMYVADQVTEEDLSGIREGVMFALGLTN